MKTTIKLTPEIFEENIENPIFLRAVTHSHKCCSANGNFLHFGALMYPITYEVSQAQKDEATALFSSKKANYLANIGNKLVFVGMGADYEPRYDDDVCNHRIRTEIVAPNGRNFFIELCPQGLTNTVATHVIDRDEEAHYDERRQKNRDKINEIGGYLPADHYLQVESRELQSQPYYWYKKKEVDELLKDGYKYTLKNVLNLVNLIFECNFTEVEIDNIYTSCDDFKSISPN